MSGRGIRSSIVGLGFVTVAAIVIAFAVLGATAAQGSTAGENVTAKSEKPYYEYNLGDATKSGHVTITDVIRTQRYSLGLDNPGTFDERLADVNRDGDVDLQDVIKIQRISIWLSSPPEAVLSSIEAPTRVIRGQTVQLNATFEQNRTARLGTLTGAHYELTDETGESVYDESAPVDIAPGESITVTFTIDTAQLDPDTYEHTVTVDGETTTQEITVVESG